MRINKVYIENHGSFAVGQDSVHSIYFYGQAQWIKVVFRDNKYRLFPREIIIQIQGEE